MNRIGYFFLGCAFMVISTLFAEPIGKQQIRSELLTAVNSLKDSMDIQFDSDVDSTSYKLWYLTRLSIGDLRQRVVELENWKTQLTNNCACVPK